MNRRYTTEEYAGIVSSIREHFPAAAITTDVMVGFPGETEEEFTESAKFVESMNFSDIHIFKYSIRPGTPAAEYKDQVQPEIKDQRSKVLEEIRAKSENKYLSQFVGKTVEVLFEQPSEKYAGYFEGKTDNYITVLVPTCENFSFLYKYVRLTEVVDGGIKGEIINK